MRSLELTAAITALANSLALRMTSDELALASCIFTQLGDTLATIGAQASLGEGEAADKE